MTNQRGVAVYGSCVSRDNFNSKFNPNYKDKYAVTLLQNQSSFVSAVAKPVSGMDSQLDGLSDWSKETVLTDLQKNFLTDYAKLKQDIVIVDNFSDVRFGYTEIFGTQVTHNVWHIGTSKFEDQFTGVKDIKPTDDLEAYLKMYRKAVKVFVTQIKAANPHALIILNCARAASDESDGTTTTKDKYNLAHFNTAWEALDKAFIETVPGCKTIHVDPDKIIGWDKHPWGAGYVHYIPAFYGEFLAKLNILVAEHKPRSLRGRWNRLIRR